MKKVALLGMGLCVALAFSSCKSSESAYKKAYEKAKQQELIEPETTAPVQVEQAVVTTTVVSTPTAAPVGTVRQEKVVLVSGEGLKAYSVVCGSFGVKANAEGLRTQLMADGYAPLVVFNAEKNMYRVVVSTFDDRQSAANARDAFKAKYPSRQDFQGSWLLYNVD